MSETNAIPNRTVAIVGRPNVGKSALFNRLVRRRIAIVHEQEGVTRDRLISPATWDEQPYTLVDTGGIGRIDNTQDLDIINSGIVEQAEAAIEDAKVLIFVVDVTAGAVPLDEAVARLLHESGCTVFIAANKADNESLDLSTGDFEAFGFRVFPVSALHGRGLDQLMGNVLKVLPPAPDPADVDPLKVAIVGRPNAGKSSYINRLIKSDRVIVSDVAGTTRDAIDVPFVIGEGPSARHYTLIDTAGMRKRTSVKDTVEQFSYLRTEKSIKRSDIAVLVMDAVEGPTDRDKKLAALISDAKKGCIILINKWDLAEDETTQRQYGAALQEALPYLSHVPVVFVSAKNGFNIRRSLEAIDYVAEQVSTKVGTGVLNRVLQNAFAKTPPPMVKGLRLKMYYATQVTSNPIRFKLFVNHPKRKTDAYTRYLERILREKLGLDAAPIYISYTARPKEKRD